MRLSPIKEIHSNALIEFSMRISQLRRQVSDFSEQTSHVSSLAALSAILLAPPNRKARHSNSCLACPQIFVNSHDCPSYCIVHFFGNICLLELWFLMELITGYGCSCQPRSFPHLRLGRLQASLLHLSPLLGSPLVPKHACANWTNSDMHSCILSPVREHVCSNTFERQI